MGILIVLPLATDVAFAVVFGVFVLAFAALAVITIAWAVRRDRPGREAWRRRQQGMVTGGGGDTAPGRSSGPEGRAPR